MLNTHTHVKHGLRPQVDSSCVEIWHCSGWHAAGVYVASQSELASMSVNHWRVYEQPYRYDQCC